MNTLNPPDWFREDYPDAKEIGHGVWVGLLWDGCAYSSLVMFHPGCPNGGISCLPVSNPKTEKSWLLTSLEPLTISPSVLCLECKHHGFIREGKWVPT